MNPILFVIGQLSVGFIMTVVLSRLLTNIDGATAIEYGLIVAGIALAIMVAVNTLGQTVLTSEYQTLTNVMTP